MLNQFNGKVCRRFHFYFGWMCVYRICLNDRINIHNGMMMNWHIHSTGPLGLVCIHPEAITFTVAHAQWIQPIMVWNSINKQTLNYVSDCFFHLIHSNQWNTCYSCLLCSLEGPAIPYGNRNRIWGVICCSFIRLWRLGSVLVTDDMWCDSIWLMDDLFSITIARPRWGNAKFEYYSNKIYYSVSIFPFKWIFIIKKINWIDISGVTVYVGALTDRETVNTPAHLSLSVLTGASWGCKWLHSSMNWILCTKCNNWMESLSHIEHNFDLHC